MGITGPAAPELLYEGRRTRVLRARGSDGRPVILKQLRSPWPDQAELLRVRREHDLLQLIDGHGAPRVLGLETSAGVELVIEDVGGVSLDRTMAAVRATPRLALEVSARLAEAIAAVHERGVVHRDVNPSNAIVHPGTHAVWLIDFDFAAEAACLAAPGATPGDAQGTPPYMAPEQTGRLNRPVDQRTDLYGLGVSLYELLGGRRPFEGADLLAYTHAHLALAPPTLQPIVEGLPAGVVALVMTLLRKSPDERYQSAAGVALDLRALLASLDDGREVALRGRELGRRAELGQDVAGRERECAQLEQTFARAAAGRRALALVWGPTGIGKTSVVRELAIPVALAGGRMLSGKYDQFSRDVPLAGLTQALDQLATELLAAPTDVVDRWRERLTAALGPSAPLLTELSAGWGHLLGAQPPLDELAPTEAEHRLQETVRRTFGTLASAEHPLVLFLDDLQWADLPSLRVLEAVFGDPELAHIMLVLAWRDREVGPDHALGPTVATLRAACDEVAEIALGPLPPEDVAALIARALHRSAQDVADLAAALSEKTAGNPFFLRRLFDEAAAAGAIRREGDGSWGWSLEAVRGLPATENVVELLQAELRRLDAGARALLSAAALLGESFDLPTLEHATGSPAAALAGGIHAAIAGRFLRPLDAGYWSRAIDDAGTPFRFVFVHDRVQQAAQELLDGEAQRAIHATVARAMLAAPDLLEPRIFRAAEHCVAALDRFVGAERAAVLDALLRAGRRAFRGAAHAPAHRFLEAAVSLVPDDLWETAPEVARELWSMSARAAWLVGRRDLLDARVAVLHAHARDAVDALRAEEIVVQARISATELHGALDAALRVLAGAGVELPRHPGMADVQAAVGATLGALAGRRIEDIAATVCDSPGELAVRGLLIRITSAAYIAEGNLVPLIACQIVRSTLEKGASASSSYGFAVFALSLSAGWLLEQGIEHGRHALTLLERFPDPAIEGTVRHVVNHYSRVWSEPLRAIYAEIPDVHRSLMNAGDLEFAGWVHHFRAVYGFFAGVPLGALAPECAGLVEGMRLHGTGAALACTMPMSLLMRGLVGELENPARLVTPEYDEAEVLPALEAAGFHAAALVLAVCELYARVLFGDVEGAAEAAGKVEALQHGAVGLYYQCPMRVVATIALLDAAGDDVPGVVARVLPWRDALVACARVNPRSGTHLLELFDAELAAARGELATATAAYDRAIDAAAANGFVHDEGLANERAARFHLGRGARRIARAYLLDARVCWARWGASAKVEHFDAAHGELAAPVGTAPRSTLTTTSSSTLGRRAEELDLASLLKASQAIAEEVELDGLLTRSMRILLENVGATRGVLLLANRGVLTLRAVGRAGDDVAIGPATAFEDGATVPPSVVRRVWRGGVTETYDDVRDAPMAREDAYLARLLAADEGHATAALCARFSHRGHALGVLYFENDLAAGAFVEDRVRVLQILAPQLAVAVRNTLLHEAQSRFVPSQYIRSLDREDIVDVELGDHRATEVTVFFSDIRGFTSVVERMAPNEALELINGYIAHAEPAITECGGFVDSYLGDGIMALFDHPERNASDAVRAAVSMHHALDRFNAERQHRGEPPLPTGIGLNTGRVILGTIGGPRAMKCGVVGDAVNLASRIEGLTKPYGVRLLVADTTVARLGPSTSFLLRSAGRVRVKGRHQPVRVYEVVDAETAAMQEALAGIRDLYEDAWEGYFAGEVARARAGFAACLAKVPTDPLSARYLMLTMQLASKGVPPGWDGTEQM